MQEREAAEQALVAAAENRKAQIVQEERARLLAEAGELQSYLPASILANQKRLPPLTPAFLD